MTNAVSVFPSTEKAVAAMATFADPRVPKCFDQLFNAVFRAQLTKTKSLAKQLVSVRTHIGLVTGVRIGDQAIVYQGPVNVALKNGTTQTIGLGVISVRVGATLAGYSYTSDVDISGALQPAIVASVAHGAGRVTVELIGFGPARGAPDPALASYDRVVKRR